MNIISCIQGLVLEGGLKEFADSCDVEKITVSDSLAEIRITLTNSVPDNRLHILTELGREIKRQAFEDENIKVTIVPKKEKTVVTEPSVGSDIALNERANPPIMGEGDKRSRAKLSTDASKGLIYGRAFEGELTGIADIDGPCNDVRIHAHILTEDQREYSQGERVIYSITLTDYTDSIVAKLFLKKSDAQELAGRFEAAGRNIIINGNIKFDDYSKELAMVSVNGIKVGEPLSSGYRKRQDTCEKKRVELHCHTKMSDMDGLTDVKELIKCVHGWGHKAVAITDHGVVQAYTEAMKAAKGLDDFKVIYGMEAYVVDDLKQAVDNADDRSIACDYVVFDIETTGIKANSDRIIEIGAVRVENGVIKERFQSFVNPNRSIPYEITELTGIHDRDVRGCDPIAEVLPRFLEFVGDRVIVAHNADFDMSFIMEACKHSSISYNPVVVDTVLLARNLVVGIKNYKLDTLAKYFDVELLNHHRADQDAYCTAQIFLKLLELAKVENPKRLKDLNNISFSETAAIKTKHPYHTIILVQNEIGRLNLYKLVSMSHLKYYQRKPRIPKSELAKHREGLLIGSACTQGELLSAILDGKSEESQKKIAKFYDYLEIQPLSNNMYLLREDSNPRLSGVDELKDINKQVVEWGKRLGKPVIAASDAHFLHPEDEIYRRILMQGQKYKNYDDPLPIYVRTTDEMLEEFSYLGSELAYEVVVENTNLIADRIEKISPVRPDKCPPVIKDSDIMLRQMCYDKARAMYGEKLPTVVEERLGKELEAIIGNGYAVMYIIANKLVKKSNEDGYLVGSRGSVGSSLVATMAGITEVNPLPPHYYCPCCHYSDFESDEVKQFARGAGCDMPDRSCPNCGAMLLKDGFDIPFETFLGFEGDKEPDIDLNFSGEYQATAHKYTEEIFGEGNTFKAGTVGTMAEKTACGYVKGYYETKGIIKRSCEIERLAQKMVGIRRTTGQHPGGIVVVPTDEDITSFTPIQYPANDEKSGIITTHFDYHSIDHNLLKLDILGHDDPSMIRQLEDLTDFPATSVSLGDKSVLSLFLSTEALGISPEDIGGCPLGVLGIPEFGTDFVIQMLLDTKPQTFSDLVRISGLSHGTNVWTGNAQVLIKEGKTDIANAICTRDDIMLYLIEKGLEASKAFTIMEQVRKGKGLKADQEEYMKSCDVPDWYIDSCKKISYMFPKAHAAAYVMMAYRIAYYKIYYPLAYYTAFYSVRADVFDYMILCRGSDYLNAKIREYGERPKLTANEKEMLKLMNIVREMYARGIKFAPIDIYAASADKFRIKDGKIMPSLTSIGGLGESVASSIEREAGIRKFNSIDDFKSRTKTDQTTTELLVELGILSGLPQSAQLSLFDCF